MAELDDVAGQIEMVLQKFKRMLEAETAGARNYERTLLTTAVYELADTIANGTRKSWL